MQGRGDITARNGSSDWENLSTGLAIIHATVNSTGAMRHATEIDEFGRPAHWWAALTGGGSYLWSVYNPADDAVYDSDNYALTGLLGGLSPGGVLTGALTSTQDRLYGIRRVEIVTADGVDQNFVLHNASSDADDLAWTNSAVISAVGVVDHASVAQPGSGVVLLGSDEGLYVSHMHDLDQEQGGLIRFDAAYASPYMKGDIRAGWPLHAVTDVAPGGHDLTNNNTVTFANGGPAGSYADFVAASSMSLQLADHADFGGMSQLTLALWLYRDVDSGGEEGLIGKWDQASGTDQSFYLMVNASDQLACGINTSSSAQEMISGVGTISLARWYYFVMTYDGVTLRAYRDGELVNSVAHTGTVDDSTEPLFIGARSSGAAATEFFDGRIGGASISATAMTQREIRAEYVRGQRRLNSAIDTNDTIPSNDIDSICVDPHGHYFGVVSGDGNLTIFDALGVPVATDAAPAGTIRDAAIKSMPGADDPHYIIATSTRMEFVQPDLRIAG